MAKKISDAGVGAFVICAVLLFALALATLGGKRIFTSNTQEYTLYFDGSVNGLSIGAPVVFRGVPMGTVNKISLVPNRKTGSGVLIAVKVQLVPEAFQGGAVKGRTDDDAPHKLFKRMVDAGLRAQLHISSIITGQYRIELDFYPNSPPVYYTADKEREIPTIASPLDAISRTIETLPLQSIAETLSGILQRLNALLTSKDLEKSLNMLPAVLTSTTRLIESATKSTDAVNREFSPTVEELRATMKHLSAAAQGVESTMRGIGTLTDDRSPTIRDLRQSIQELAAAARAVRQLAETLERHPESVFIGKGGTRR